MRRLEASPWTRVEPVSSGAHPGHPIRRAEFTQATDLRGVRRRAAASLTVRVNRVNQALEWWKAGDGVPGRGRE